MGGWVYRRPFFRQPRRFLPLDRRQAAWFFTRRRTVSRRRLYNRRRAQHWLAPNTHGHNAHWAGISRAIRRQRRRGVVKRRAALPGGKTAAAVGGHAIRLQRSARRQKGARQQRRIASVGTVAAPVVVNNKIGAMIRFRKAIAKLRRNIQARLRWKPRPEDEVAVLLPQERVEQAFKGTLAAPGLVRGHVQGGG